MHSLRLVIYESAVLQLLKQEAILSAHSMYKVWKTVFTLQYNCLPEAHSFHPTEQSRCFNYNTCISYSKLPVLGLNMDDNGKTIISSQSAELVERKTKLNKMLIGLNFLKRTTLDENLWCDNAAILPRHFLSYAAVWPVIALFRNNKNHFHISIRSFF